MASEERAGATDAPVVDDINAVLEAYHPFCRSLLTLYFSFFMYIVAFALTFLPTVAKVELVIGGKYEATSDATLVVVTSTFINGLSALVFSKYFGSLSDHVGRKPLIFSSIVLGGILSRFIILHATSASHFYLAAFISGTFDCMSVVVLAWVADLLNGETRGKGFGLLSGLGFGIGFSVGIPVGGVLLGSNGQDPDTPLIAALCIWAVNAILWVLLPIPDTLGILPINSINDNDNDENNKQEQEILDIKVSGDNENKEVKKKNNKSFDGISSSLDLVDSSSITLKKRHLPPNWSRFLWDNFPATIFMNSAILSEGDSPSDFISYFWAQSGTFIEIM